MVLPILLVLGGAAATALVGEFIRRPVKDLTEGMLLTEELPTRQAIRLYAEGYFTMSQFKDSMKAANIREDHQAALINMAVRTKYDNLYSAATKTQEKVAAQIEALTYQLADADAAQINSMAVKLEAELKDVLSDSDTIDRAEVDLLLRDAIDLREDAMKK